MAPAGRRRAASSAGGWTSEPRRRRRRNGRIRSTRPPRRESSTPRRRRPCCTWPLRREGRSNSRRRRGSASISVTKRSCRTCWPSRREQWWTSRTRTPSITTCSRCRRRHGSTSDGTPPAARRSVRFERPGIVRVFCDIHSHMNAFVLVFSHPFFAVTDDGGAVSHRRRAARLLQPGRLERQGVVRAEERGGRRRRGQPDRVRRRHEHLLVAPQPDLRHQRAAGGALDCRRDLPRQRARHPRARAAAAARDRHHRRHRRTARRQPGADVHADGAVHRRRAEAQGGSGHGRSRDRAGRRSTTTRPRCSSNLLFVTNRNGAKLASVGSSSALGSARSIGCRQYTRPTAGRERVTLLAQPDGVLQLVSVPIAVGIERPDILGTLNVGFLFDAALASRLKGITGSDIAFGIGGRILATTLEPGVRRNRWRRCSSARRPGGETLETSDFVVRPLHLASAQIGPAPRRGANRADHPLARRAAAGAADAQDRAGRAPPWSRSCSPRF